MTKTDGSSPQVAETPQWQPSDIAAAVRATPMTAAEYADLILAVRESIPNLLPPDKSIRKRLNWALRLSPRFVQSIATGLDTSTVWQASADANPGELREHLGRADELRPLAEQADALNSLVQFNTDYHHFVAADKARVAYNVGSRLGGNEGKSITAHLQIARTSLPRRHKATAATNKFIPDFPAPPKAKE